MPPTGSLNKIPHCLLVERSLPEPATCTLPHCCGPWCRPDPPGALLAPRFGCILRIFQQACPDRNQFEVKSMLSQYVATVVPSCLPGVAQSTRTRCLQRPAICSQLLGVSAEPPVGGRHARGHRHCSRCLPLDCRRGSSGCDCSESSDAGQLAVGLLRGQHAPFPTAARQCSPSTASSSAHWCEWRGPMQQPQQRCGWRRLHVRRPAGPDPARVENGGEAWHSSSNRIASADCQRRPRSIWAAALQGGHRDREQLLASSWDNRSYGIRICTATYSPAPAQPPHAHAPAQTPARCGARGSPATADLRLQHPTRRARPPAHRERSAQTPPQPAGGRPGTG